MELVYGVQPNCTKTGTIKVNIAVSSRALLRLWGENSYAEDSRLITTAREWEGRDMMMMASLNKIRENHADYESGDANYQKIGDRAKPKPVTRNPHGRGPDYDYKDGA